MRKSGLTTTGDRRAKRLLAAGLAVFQFSAMALAAQRLHIEAFTLRAAESDARTLKPGAGFDVGLRVANHDAGKLTFVLRTVEPIEPEDAPPALDRYEAARRFAFLAEGGGVQLGDGGPHDQAPEPNAFRVRLSTEGWKPGRYELGLFAHNSTDKKHGRYEAVCAKFAVEVGPDRVRLIDRFNPSETRMSRAGFRPEAVLAGQGTQLSVALTRADLIGLSVTMALRVAPENALPDFRYDQATRTASLADPGASLLLDGGKRDVDPAPGVVEVPLRTDGLKPGIYLMTVTANAREGRPDERRVALRIKDPADRLEVTVSEPWGAWDGAGAGRFTRLKDGTLLFGGRLSADGGRTWQQPPGKAIQGGCPVLSDGRVLALDYGLVPIDGRPEWYTSSLRSSRDGGRTVQREAAECHVPLAKAARGHAPHRGPLCTGSFVQCDDGSVLALMMGWFVGDDALCPYGRSRPYSRSYVCASRDGGRVWTYLSTIGSGAIGSEGYNEGAIEKLNDGSIVAVLRTGNMTDVACQDNPVMVSRSADGGRTWKKPWRSGVNGAYPDVELLSDGLLALSTGRPGAVVVFSLDRGDTWHDLTLVDGADESGYTALVETGPGELLVAFGEGYVRPDGKGGIRMAHVRYHRRPEQAK